MMFMGTIFPSNIRTKTWGSAWSAGLPANETAVRDIVNNITLIAQFFRIIVPSRNLRLLSVRLAEWWAGTTTAAKIILGVVAGSVTRRDFGRQPVQQHTGLAGALGSTVDEKTAVGP